MHLDMPGMALYLQFKRADCMLRRSAREIRSHDLPLSVPFYRFKITEAGKSDQHELLLALDDGESAVYYAAPRFHELGEINAAWDANEVASRSIFVAPAVIGELDSQSHHVAFDDDQAFVCSDPKPIVFLSGAGLVAKLRSRLQADGRPFREKIPELIGGLERARNRAQERTAESRRRTMGAEWRALDEYEARVERMRRPVEPVPTRRARTLSGPERDLRQLSDTAARNFNAQLIVVQEPH